MKELIDQIDSIFALWQKGECPGGQVTVKKGGKVIYDRCCGYANLEHGIPIHETTRFHVASVSKQVTVLSALLLCEDGKLKLDEDIRAYVPDLIHFEEPVTVRDLMNNVSGIRDQWELLMLRGVRIDDTITMEDLKTAISMQRALNFEPKSEYLYSNSNFTLLAEMVERLSGKSLNEFATERIFKPLGMDHTCVKEHFSQIIPEKAYSYDDNGEGKFCYHVINFAAYGATSLHTTSHDLIRLLDHYRNPSVCSKETVALMKTTPVLADGSKSIYGGGLMVGSYKGHSYFEHGGVDAAYRAHVMCFDQDDLEIAIVCNTQNTIPGVAARKIADLVLQLPETASAAESFKEEAEEAENAAGIYMAVSPSLIRVVITCRDGNLYLGSGARAPRLHQISGNCWQVGYTADRVYLGREKAALQMGLNLFALRKLSQATENEEKLLEYEGRYESAELETAYEIFEEGGCLFASHIRHGKQRIYPCGKDAYLMDLGEVTSILRFTRGSGNQVIGLVLDGGRVRHIGFTKAE